MPEDGILLPHMLEDGILLPHMLEDGILFPQYRLHNWMSFGT
jgi:hypothetical protein